MVETGEVVEIKGNTAKVKISKKEECSKCGMCLFSNNANFIEIIAENKVGAKLNDIVKVVNEQSGKLLSIFLVFGVPLLLLIACVVIGYFCFEKDWYSVLLYIPILVLWEIIQHFIDKKIRKKMKVTSYILNIEETLKGENK